MNTADVVIGAGFGDEGKGLMTDVLCAAAGNALVVRFNGGAQAGHTVTTQDGQRHVFSHFGSGSFCAAPTFLSRFFVCNPLLFLREKNILAQKGIKPEVFCDPQAPVTTPYDMIANQMAEDARGNARHGSCGLGFGETLERDSHDGFRIRAADLGDKAALDRKLARIRDAWLPQRLEKLGIAAIGDDWRARIFSPRIMKSFIDDCAHFADTVKTATIAQAAKGKHIVFEGAQGLLLDQARGFFPHVTRSYTGIRNVLPLAQEADVGELNVVYVTRAYATRHGAGPLPHELPAAPYKNIVDATNIENAYQGRLRFGWLDLDLLGKSIADDLSDASGATVRIEHALAITCLDQIDAQAGFISGGTPRKTRAENFVQNAAQAARTHRLYISRGPSRTTCISEKIL